MIESRLGPWIAMAFTAMTLATGCRDDSSRAPTPPEPTGHEPAVDEGVADWQATYDAWEYPQPIPNFPLVDHDGKRFGLRRFADGHVLVGFIFTRCPVADACPLTTEKMLLVQKRWNGLGAARGDNELRLLSITLDPDYDTPEVLRRYATARGVDLSSWVFATGPKKLVQDALPALFGILALEKSPAQIQHSVKTALLGPGLTIVKEWRNNEFTPDEVTDLVLR